MPPGDGWTDDPYRAIERDGRLYGLGACDMKAGVAAMLEAAGVVRRAGVPLRGRVLVDAVIDEELGGTGTLRTVEGGRRADFAIVVEPTGLDVVRVGNGQVNFEVEFHGAAGHGSAPESGHNAIYDAAAFVTAIARESAAMAADPVPLIGPPTYNVGVIGGGLRTSIHPRPLRGRGRPPHRARPDGRRCRRRPRSRPGAGRRRSPRRAGHRIVGIRYEPFEVPEAAPICQVVRAAATDVTGRSVEFTGMRATTDAVFLTEAGTPTIVFGPAASSRRTGPTSSSPSTNSWGRPARCRHHRPTIRMKETR